MQKEHSDSEIFQIHELQDFCEHLQKLIKTSFSTDIIIRSLNKIHFFSLLLSKLCLEDKISLVRICELETGVSIDFFFLSFQQFIYDQGQYLYAPLFQPITVKINKSTIIIQPGLCVVQFLQPKLITFEKKYETQPLLKIKITSIMTLIPEEMLSEIKQLKYILNNNLLLKPGWNNLTESLFPLFELQIFQKNDQINIQERLFFISKGAAQIQMRKNRENFSVEAAFIQSENSCFGLEHLLSSDFEVVSAVCLINQSQFYKVDVKVIIYYQSVNIQNVQQYFNEEYINNIINYIQLKDNALNKTFTGMTNKQVFQQKKQEYQIKKSNLNFEIKPTNQSIQVVSMTEPKNFWKILNSSMSQKDQEILKKKLNKIYPHPQNTFKPKALNLMEINPTKNIKLEGKTQKKQQSILPFQKQIRQGSRMLIPNLFSPPLHAQSPNSEMKQSPNKSNQNSNSFKNQRYRSVSEDIKQKFEGQKKLPLKMVQFINDPTDQILNLSPKSDITFQKYELSDVDENPIFNPIANVNLSKVTDLRDNYLTKSPFYEKYVQDQQKEYLQHNKYDDQPQNKHKFLEFSKLLDHELSKIPIHK